MKRAILGVKSPPKQPVSVQILYNYPIEQLGGDHAASLSGARLQMNTSLQLQLYIYIYIYIYIYMYIYIYIYTYTYIYIYVSLSLSLCLSPYVYIYIYIYTYNIPVVIHISDYVRCVLYVVYHVRLHIRSRHMNEFVCLPLPAWRFSVRCVEVELS